MKKGLVRLVGLIAPLAYASLALAQEGEAATGSSGSPGVGLAAGIAIGAAVIGGGLGQGRAAATALEGIARNPNASNKVFVPMILGLAFIESLVLFAWIIANTLAGKA